MRTIVHITAGNEDWVLTGEELAEQVLVYHRHNICAWPTEIFRMDDNDGFVATLAPELEAEHSDDVQEMVRQLLNDPEGGVLATRPGIVLTRVSGQSLKSNIKEQPND